MIAKQVIEKASAFRLRCRWMLEARRMRVMQLMRQDVALSAARGWAGIEPPLRAKYALMRGLSNPLIPQASPPSTPSLVLEGKGISSVH
ncbi:hypothetical protein CXF77_14450 [Planococcus sp. MB-3u-09]|nr:hypothetical protein CW734_04295 [Planococcus sp. MB-3u-03]PKG45477.1 hypothetical protein CXF66_12755 [Planococcus sp. Urea-trap-24]PKG88926.1 hypothetical protein CXF91_08780 [Planococcus sp. Urea-3u-39]PKH36294.1 hypothetical protein CXF77_14450 [Planococcus sp. MB-3u-09]